MAPEHHKPQTIFKSADTSIHSQCIVLYFWTKITDTGGEGHFLNSNFKDKTQSKKFFIGSKEWQIKHPWCLSIFSGAKPGWGAGNNFLRYARLPEDFWAFGNLRSLSPSISLVQSSDLQAEDLEEDGADEEGEDDDEAFSSPHVAFFSFCWRKDEGYNVI